MDLRTWLGKERVREIERIALMHIHCHLYSLRFWSHLSPKLRVRLREGPLKKKRQQTENRITVVLCLCYEMKLFSHVQLFATPMDCNLPGSTVHGIFQVRVLEWVAIFLSRGSSWPRDRTWVSLIAGRRFFIWATVSSQSCFSDCIELLHHWLQRI